MMVVSEKARRCDGEDLEEERNTIMGVQNMLYGLWRRYMIQMGGSFHLMVRLVRVMAFSAARRSRLF